MRAFIAILSCAIWALISVNAIARDRGATLVRADPTDGKRVALVAGNAAYRHATPLRNPKNDAVALSAVLRRLGFQVIVGLDLTRAQLEAKAREFALASRGAKVALFFYAGHGLQVNGRNYLAPVDAKLADEADLIFETVRLDDILAQMERERRTNLVLLDACRDNPLARNLARSMGTRSTSVGAGLARVESGIGTLIAFATQPGNVALDGQGKHSPFADALLRHIETPNLDVALLMRRVREEVMANTGDRQVPWSNSSLTGSFAFLQDGPGGGNAPSAKPVRPPLSPDAQAWAVTKDSKSMAVLGAFIAKFPDSIYASFAKARIAELEKAAEQKVAIGVDPETADFESDPTPTDPEGALPLSDTITLARTLQTELKRVGCYSLPVDGIWGRLSRQALAAFNRHAQQKLDVAAPTISAIDVVKSKSARVCPAVVVKPARAAKPKAPTKVINRKAAEKKVVKPRTVKKASKKKTECRTVYAWGHMGLGGKTICE